MIKCMVKFRQLCAYVQAGIPSGGSGTLYYNAAVGILPQGAAPALKAGLNRHALQLSLCGRSLALRDTVSQRCQPAPCWCRCIPACTCGTRALQECNFMLRWESMVISEMQQATDLGQRPGADWWSAEVPVSKVG